jgi:Laminin G domain
MRHRGRIRTFGAMLMVAALGMIALGSSTPIGAAATVTLTNWQMNESAGTNVMIDSSGHGINGVVGSAILTGNTENGVTFYRWTSTNPNQPPPKPERLVQVNNSTLNPGTRDYAITVRFRTTHNYGNMIQKGQSGAPGGYFKWQIPSGNLSCLFRGRSSTGAILSKQVSSGTIKLNDGQWHTVKCERTADRVTMTIDGVLRRTALGPTGSISNTVPLTIGGKLNCDQVSVTCDYFAGDIDYVQIQTS